MSKFNLDRLIDQEFVKGQFIEIKQPNNLPNKVGRILRVVKVDGTIDHLMCMIFYSEVRTSPPLRVELEDCLKHDLSLSHYV